MNIKRNSIAALLRAASPALYASAFGIQREEGHLEYQSGGAQVVCLLAGWVEKDVLWTIDLSMELVEGCV